MPVESEDEISAAAQSLVSQGVETVIVTLGARGSLLATRGGSQRIAPVKVQAVDTTGAGDAFIGSFARYLAGGLALEAALTAGDALFRLLRHPPRRAEILPTEAEFAAFGASPIEQAPRSGRLLADFLADIHPVRIAAEFALKAAFVVAAALHLDRLHPLDRLVSAVAECLEARGHVELRPVGPVGIDDRRPLARRVITSSQQQKSQDLAGPVSSSLRFRS